MGVGDSLEAAFTLAGPIRAGTWHLVGDGIVLYSADIRYDVIWRHGGSDLTLVSWMHHFDPLTGPKPFDATPFEADGQGIAAPAQAGDQLVLRFTGTGGVDGGTGAAFIPNGDGAKANANIPSLTLPYAPRRGGPVGGHIVPPRLRRAGARR